MTEAQIREKALQLADKDGDYLVMSIQPDKENEVLFVCNDPMVFWSKLTGVPLAFDKEGADYVTGKLKGLYKDDLHFTVKKGDFGL